MRRLMLMLCAFAVFTTTRPHAQTEGRIVGPDSIIHSVADLDASVAFYHDVVGLPLDTAPAFPSGKSATLIVPGGDLPLTLVQFPGAGARPIHPRLQDPGNLKTVMRVRDMDAAFERVRAKVAGVFTEGGLPIHPEGPTGFNRAVIMRDPDGFPLEFAFQNGPIAADVPATSIVIGGWATFIVEDAAATLAFYRDVLGFQATGAPTPLAAGVLSLQGLPAAAGSMSVGVRPPGGAATWRMYDYRNVERTRLAGRLQDPGTVALSFRVENVSLLLSRLKTAGVAVETPLAKVDGRMRAFVRDPNGLLLELIEAGE